MAKRATEGSAPGRPGAPDMQLHQNISDSRRSSSIDFLYVSAYQKGSVRRILAPLVALWGVLCPFWAKKAHFQEPEPPTGASLGRAPCLSGESFLTPIPPKRPPIAPTKFFSSITLMPFFFVYNGENATVPVQKFHRGGPKCHFIAVIWPKGTI